MTLVIQKIPIRQQDVVKTSWQGLSASSSNVAGTSQTKHPTTSLWNVAKTSQGYFSATPYWNAVATSQEDVTTTSHQYVFTTSQTCLKWNTQRRLISTSIRRLDGTYPPRRISTSLRRLLLVSNKTTINVAVVRPRLRVTLSWCLFNRSLLCFEVTLSWLPSGRFTRLI